jgi:hypothetical protein
MADNLIAEISRLGFRNLNTPPSASISDVQHLASYNWIEAPRATPTIAVPDSPALWSPPDKPFRVGKDTGHFYIAQNAARHPGSPLEPLFRALYVSHPSFDIASIDVVTDRNNIRKLLSLINPRWSGHKREDSPSTSRSRTIPPSSAARRPKRISTLARTSSGVMATRSRRSALFVKLVGVLDIIESDRMVLEA